MHPVEYELFGFFTTSPHFSGFFLCHSPFPFTVFPIPGPALQFPVGGCDSIPSHWKAAAVHCGMSRFYYRQALEDSKASSTFFIA
ncbi:hypothetical protein [Paraburkholderia phytofirmans]|uniref:hypothetical protein n=1 Tax=Paraburkholderia phytofirmans TaxID=261302 RepID=UPI0038B8455A